MRTTVRIDDDLLRQLKDRAHRENVSVAQLVNQVIRHGLKSPTGKPRPYREKTFNMGKPLMNLDKALSIAGELEAEEIIRKMKQGR
jgi:hypothetical protein